MKNKLRTKEYIKLKHCINSCVNIDQLKTLQKIVFEYCEKHSEYAAGLMNEFMLKEKNLHVFDYEEDSMESLFHQRNCRAQN